MTRTTPRRLTRGLTLAASGLAVLALAACSSGDPLDAGSADETPLSPTGETTASGGASGQTVVVGSQDYYSNEIVAEIYAQALEQAGWTVERQFRIGQREAYIPAIENGEVQVFPEYTGNLLQYFDPDTTATKAADVEAALAGVLPDGLAVLDPSPATDQDSYNVTSAFAQEHSLTSIADLAGVDVPLILGGQPELAERPYGPTGLESVYGVTVQFSPTGDTTVDELVAGSVNIANVYSADPRIASEDLVTLEDPEGLFLASNVVPLVQADLADALGEVLNPVSAALTPEGLVALNVESVDQQRSAADIAADWLSENGFAG
ncbi:ABC transporter substrate-binding protein [Miniimonas sp. S16]|uniref:ABC transporter substrate-binding protein n=1 Tax=Miniimonas sp. S16 TaxID=2171623 RepID=UPI000D529AAC|nr:ABC transporter substrate-binding protein [Miniimonas sp. S16]